MRYIYFNRENKESVAGDKGIICVGYERSEDGLKVGVSFCSPGDHFDKKYHAHQCIPKRVTRGKFSFFEADAKNMGYEEIVAFVKTRLNEAFPADYTSVKAFVEAHKHKAFPMFAGIKLPYWFKPVE
jgi:hypothetical protein